MNKISVVINAYNEERNIQKAISSVKWADEIVVCDAQSQDKTVEIAKKLGARVVAHKYTGYVEPARNFAISQASNEWILILDADEEIPPTLAAEIRNMLNRASIADFIRIPRKNIIFGNWMKASMWWPDYNVRLFKKGAVIWSEKIHVQPQTTGSTGIDLPADENLAIIHNNYQGIEQYLARLNRYTTIEADQLFKDGYKFSWNDLIKKPVDEFLSRFFANKGYLDGLHGLSLSVLQAFSFFIVYLKVWEKTKFSLQQFSLKEVEVEKKKAGYSINYWFLQTKLSKNPIKNILEKVKNKL